MLDLSYGPKTVRRLLETAAQQKGCCIALGNQARIGFEKMYADHGLKVSIKDLVGRCNVMSNAQMSVVVKKQSRNKTTS